MNNETEQIFLLNSNGGSIQLTVESQKPTVTTSNNLQNVLITDNMCRTCATVTEFIIPIFHGEGLQNNLAEKIHKHLPIQVLENDDLPQAVCYQCASTLLAWHELVECCVQADTALRTRRAVTTSNILVQEVKPGPSTDTYDVAVQPNVEKEKEPQNKCNPRVTFTTYHSAHRELNAPHLADRSRPSARRALQSILEPDTFTSCSGDEHNAGDTDLEDDEPLSTIAFQKQNVRNTAYNIFYDALVNFRTHYVSKHKDETCSYPEFTESSDSDAVEHEPPTHEERDVDKFDDLTRCNMRKDRMDEATRIELNEVQVKVNGKMLYACKLCGKKLSSTHTYVFHQRTHTGERPCVCHVCGARFTAPSGLQRHLTETHERARRHACSLCGNHFANSQNLKQHMRTHTGEKPYVCARCGKRFAQSGSLHAHRRTHSDHFPFQCAECGAKFRIRSGLARHRLKHTGERPHVCVHCGKAFRQKHELNCHSAAHSQDKPHACLVCGATFRQKRTLKHHCKKLHESAAPASPVPILYSQVRQYGTDML